MVSKHISRDHSAHKKHIIRPYDEYVKFEVFSFDPKHTKIYVPMDSTLKKGSNLQKTSWKSWSCYKSKDMENDMVFNINYNAKVNGNYRIDFIYEQNDYIHKDNDGKISKKNTGKDLVGHLKVTRGSINVHETNMLMDGENNIIKRKTGFLNHLNKGVHNIEVHVPSNIYFMGIIIRRVVRFVGDNYYGDNLGNEKGSLTLTTASLTNSDMLKPSELQVEIAYDDKLECANSPSGFYIDYMDECNFYIKDNDNVVQRVFGGYVSSILPDAERTKLTIHCADRLNDGLNKYILDQMVLMGGTKDQKTDEYSDGMTKNFNSYPEALKYLCNIHEITLKSNISKNYTVDGEKFHRGFVITYGKKKRIKKITTVNGMATSQNNYIDLRNKSSSMKKQVFTLYDAKKNSKKPPNITNYPYMHITYGLGDRETSYQTKVTETVDTAEVTAGSQKFGRCGVSQDGKYIMAIGTTSSAKDEGSWGTYYKGVYKNKCPHCGEAKLVWDSCRPDTNCVTTGNWGGSKRSFPVDPIETEITCNGCDSDFSAQGIEKDGPWARLERVSKITESSKAEQDKLHRGEMVAVPESGLTIKPDDIFKAITKEAFKYRYVLGADGQTYDQMKAIGYGDCWGFSDLIYTMLKKYGVKCKIVQYDTGYNHRSVLYVNEKGEWEDFPYREYGWNTRYNNNLNNTSDSKYGDVIAINKSGNRISNCKGTSTSTTKSQTTTITHTRGYNIKNPFHAYVKIVYSLKQSFNAKKYAIYLKFTENATAKVSLNTGLNVYWLNNKIKKATQTTDMVDFLRKTVHGEKANIYLQSIQFIAPAKKPRQKKNGKGYEDTTWYKLDKTTDDQSSCKMRLYQITFDDRKGAESSELNTCGKTVNDEMKDIVKEAGYYVDMTYGLHRRDDKINFRVANQSRASFVASEGDNNNILSWNNISYSPVGSMHNMSMQLFKKKDGSYWYVDTRSVTSIMKYQEQCTLQTSSENITEKEAYWNAIMSDKYEPTQRYSYTITVPNYPHLRLGDMVQVRANAKKLNNIKEVNSIKVTFQHDKMPRIQTQLGLDELAPDIQLKKNIRNLRRKAKQQNTYFNKNATPVTDEIYYEWDE